jgi:predicted permease
MHWWRKVAFRIRALFKKRQLDAEMEEELQLHIELQTQANIKAGKNAKEARYAALRKFGSLEKIKQTARDERGVRWVEDFLHDLRFGGRMLRKSPGFTAVAVLTLALGIGANTAIFSVVNTALLRPLPFKDADQIVMLWESNPKLSVHEDLPTPANVLDWQKDNTVFEHIGVLGNAGSSSRNFLLQSDEASERLRGRFASSGFFNVMGVTPVLGRTFLPEEDKRGSRPAAVLSYTLWQRRFAGDTEIVGKTLKLDDSYTVIGVMPPGFHFPQDSEIWLSLGLERFAAMDRRDAHYYFAVARLKPGVSLKQARTEMDAIQHRLAAAYPEVRIGTHVNVIPLLDQVVGTKTKRTLLVLLGAVGFVLLIACANVANLLLARASIRRTEIAVRLALGAGWARIIRQLLTESVLIAVMGGAVGVLFALWGVNVFTAMSPGNTPGVMEIRFDRLKDVRLDSTVLGFTLVVSLLTGLVFGLAPALQSTSLELNESLKQDGRTVASGSRVGFIRNALMVSEVALALVLLTGAGLMLQSFTRLQQVNPGLETHGALSVEIDMAVAVQTNSAGRHDAFRQLLERVRAMPGVRAAGGVSELPLTAGGWTEPFVVERRPSPSGAQTPTLDIRVVTPEFFRATGIPILRGRDVSENDDEDAPKVAVINDAMARRFFSGENPLGKRLSLRQAGAWIEIVGIVGDVKHHGLDSVVRNDLYVPYRQIYFGGPELGPSLVVRTAFAPSSLITPLRSELGSQLAVTIQPLDQLLSRSFGQPRLRTLLLAFFGCTALLLATIGIYGVISYSVAQRTHEMGVRMALGAQRGDLLKLILGNGLRLTLIGLVIGIGAALLLARALSGLLFEVSPADAKTFAGVSLLLGFVALAACYIPARRAAEVNPMEALRYE